MPTTLGDPTSTYYASEGFAGYGAELLVGNAASPEVFEAVAFVVSITPGAMSTTVIDRTHLRSPAAHMEKLAGLRDSGAFTAELIWAPTHRSQSNAGGGSGAFATGGLIDMWINRTEHNFKVKLADGSPATEFPFRGIVTRFQPGTITGNDKVNCTVEMTPVRDFSASLP
jgi:hypothetical protein